MTNKAFARLTSALLTTAVLILLGFTVAVSLLASPAQAHQVACTTDLDCAAYELGQAIESGTTVHEDLSFDGASPLYSAKNDLLADAFWACHAGEDWTTAKRHLAAWVTAYRAA